MAITPEIIEELMKEYQNPEDLTGKDGLFKQLQKAMLERAMNAEMTHHLGYKKNEKGKSNGNHRNGKSSKTIKGNFGEMNIETPRDRDGSYAPQIIPKRQSRFDGFDHQIISMYARGMSVRDIQGHLKEMYGVNVSHDLISEVTDEIIDEVREWQNRALDAMYPIVFFDAIVVKAKEEGHIRNKSVYFALAVNIEGKKDLLGMWIEQTEGAKFWMRIMNELANRGVKDILIASVDGLKGFEEAIHSVFPETEIQLCIVHMIRNSLKFVSYKDRKEITESLKAIYKAPTEEKALIELDHLSDKWDNKYPLISKSWKANWDKIAIMFNYSPEIRKAIYTTNAIESLNYSLKKILKNRGSFSTDDAIFKLLYLAVNNISKKWTMPIQNWGVAINQFAVIFENRVTDHLHS